MSVMLIVCFFAFLSYGSYSYISYNSSIRSHQYFYFYGLSLALLSNLLWLYGVKVLNNRDQIFWLGISFDFIVTFTSIAIPIFFFDLKLNRLTWIGVGFLIVGIFIIKQFGISRE